MIALLPAYLTKAYVRGHLRTLADGRAIQVHPYHTKTAAASREDTRTRDIFADIPPAENQHRPRIHPARTTTPRKAVVPFQAVYPQLFDDKPLASDQNGHYNKDDKGRNPAPATEGKKMTTLNESQKKAMVYMVGIMRTNPGWEKGLYEHAMRWAGFNEWSGNDAKRRYYFNDPDEPNEKMFGYFENREVKWNGGYEGAKKKVFKELNAKHVAKMQSAYDKAMDEMKAYIQENRQSLPIVGEGTVGEVRGVPGHAGLGPYIRREDGKWDIKEDAPATEGKKMDSKPRTIAEIVQALGAKDDTGKPVHPSAYRVVLADEIKDAKAQISAMEERPRPALADKIAAKKAWLAEAEAAMEREGKANPEQAKPGRIYLSVPYAEKDKAKTTADKAGTRIRFDGDKKKWYWEGEGELPGALARWAPEGANPEGGGEPAMDDERKKLVALFDGDHAKADALQQVYIEIIKAAVMRTQPKAGKDLWETAKKEFGPREKNAYAHYMEFKRLQASAGQTPIHASDREIYENAHGQWAAEKKYGRRE